MKDYQLTSNSEEKNSLSHMKFDDVRIGNLITREFYHYSAHQTFDYYFEQIVWSTKTFVDIHRCIGQHCMLGSTADRLGAHALHLSYLNYKFVS
jgi:hypothetical protein